MNLIKSFGDNAFFKWFLGAAAYSKRLEDEIQERRMAEESLMKTNQELRDLTANLEKRVEERTCQLKEQSEQLRRLAVQLTEAEESERKKLAQILHDHLQQLLVAAKMRLTLIARKDNISDKEAFNELIGFIDQAYDSSRTLTAQLRPPVLYEGGLVAALRFLARKFHDQYKLKVNVSATMLDEPNSQFLKSMIYSCVQEMLFNAVKYSGADECWVTLEKNEINRVSVVVRDQGAGFDPQHIGRKGSHGFGLFSIRERMQALGGECRIESQPGDGARFFINVPDQVIESKTDEIPRPAITAKPHRKSGLLTVVLADDHKIVRQSLAQLLSGLPFIRQVIEAEDGRDVINKVFEFNPDVVIMDMNMPNMNGIEATREVRHIDSRIKIIGLSVQTEKETMEAMKESGAIAYFHKGQETDVLIEALRSLSETMGRKRPAKRFGQLELTY